MTLIDALNEMIGFVGESPIDATDPDYAEHPLYESALRVLNTASRKVQSKGWWFNTNQIDMAVVSGGIAVSADILSLEVVRDGGDMHAYAIRDGALYDLTDDTATLTDDVTANIRRLVTFDELPETAAAYITARAVTAFARTYDGGAQKIADAKDEEGIAFIPFHADHIRNSHVNLYATPTTGRALANTWYSRYRLR